MRYPVDSVAEGLMKKFEVTEVDAKTFVAKAILDGQKLDKFGYGKGDGTDRVRLWKKVVMDDANLTLTVQDFVPEAALGAWVGEASDKVPLNNCIVQFERKPPRLIFIFDDQEGKRQADDAMKNALYTWSDAIVGGVITFKTSKVQVTGNAPSIVDGGKTQSMITSPMDDLVGYDKFWDQHLKYCKDFVRNMPGAQCEDISPDEFKGTVVLDPANPSEVTTHKIVSSKSDNKVNWTVEYQGKVVSEMHRIVHQSPLVLEGWDMDASGTRVAGTSKAKEMQKAVNEIVRKASSWFGCMERREVPAATPLVPFVLKGPPPSCTKEDRVKALKYAAVVPPSAKKANMGRNGKLWVQAMARFVLVTSSLSQEFRIMQTGHAPGPSKGCDRSPGAKSKSLGGPDIFVHKRNVRRDEQGRRVALKEGERVEFELQPDRSPCHFWRSAAGHAARSPARSCRPRERAGPSLPDDWATLQKGRSASRVTIGVTLPASVNVNAQRIFCTDMQRRRPDHDRPAW
ncbi:scoF [Symbiodinium sp. CCMP2456]|nr:scoF [Symbiodinium sp. CCMP2456]